jgi:hypothetical protein
MAARVSRNKAPLHVPHIWTCVGAMGQADCVGTGRGRGLTQDGGVPWFTGGAPKCRNIYSLALSFMLLSGNQPGCWCLHSAQGPSDTPLMTVLDPQLPDAGAFPDNQQSLFTSQITAATKFIPLSPKSVQVNTFLYWSPGKMDEYQPHCGPGKCVGSGNISTS